MVWMRDEDFQKEHTTLPRILRTGTKAARAKEADKQEAEGKEMAEAKKNEEHGKGETGIQSVEIEPAESGGFVTRVRHKDKPSKDGKSPSVYAEPDLHVHANTEQLAKFLTECFPSPTSRSKKGKSETKEAGGSRVDTYESEQGDDIK